MTFREPSLAERMATLPDDIVPRGSTALVPVRTAEIIAADIQRSHEDYEASGCKAADKAVETGRLLNELKARVRREFGHGFWEAYVTEKFPFSMRTAQNYMNAAKAADRKLLIAKENEGEFRFLAAKRGAKIIGAIEKERDKKKASK